MDSSCFGVKIMCFCFCGFKYVYYMKYYLEINIKVNFKCYFVILNIYVSY